MSNGNCWMPLYIGDYLGDTMELDAAQHGAYLLLLMYYWRNGPLPMDDAKLAQIARTELRVWRKTVGPIVKGFFREREGRLHQKRADLEMAKAAECQQRTAEKRQVDNDRLKAWRAKTGSHPSEKANGTDPPETPMKRVSNALRNADETPDESVAKRVPQVHSQVQSDSEREERKEVTKLTSFSSTMRARPEPPGDALSALLTDAGIDKPERIDRSGDEPASSDPVILATIRRATKACSMRVPYGEVRSVEAQLAALEAQPAAVGADMTMGLKWRPAEPARSPAEQLVALLGISLADAESRIGAAA